MARTVLYLVRHGEQDHSEDGAEPDAGLSATGRQQAHLLGRRLATVPFTSVRHSPLRRAAETARILATYLPGVPVNPSELVGDRTPIPTDDEAGGMPERYRPFLNGIPAGERDPGARHLSEAVRELTTVGTDDRVDLLVTHNFVIGWFVRHALDAPAWRWLGLNQANCGLTIIRADGGRPPTLVAFNDVGHLPG
jgi:serine/threonine-protein phosphatase PGAM5